MTLEQVRKYKEVIKWFCDNSDKGVWYYFHKNEDWVLTHNPKWYEDYIYVQNDKYVKFRKALAEGKEIQYTEDNGKTWFTNFNKLNTFYTPKNMRIKLTTEYPIYKIADKGTNKKYIVKFTEKKQGEVVFALPDSYHDIGIIKDNWILHTDKRWEDVPYSKEKDLYHKQLVECWDNDSTHTRAVRFYDAINDCTFSGNGISKGFSYQNYKAISINRYDDWVFEAYQTLED